MSISEIIQREIDQYVSRTPMSAKMQQNAELFLPGGSSRGTAYFDPYPHFIRDSKYRTSYAQECNERESRFWCNKVTDNRHARSEWCRIEPRL